MRLFGPPNVDRLSAKGDIAGLSKALRHQSEEVRDRAARALVTLGNPRALEALLDIIGVIGNVRLNQAVHAAQKALRSAQDPRVVEWMWGVVAESSTPGSARSDLAEIVLPKADASRFMSVVRLLDGPPSLRIQATRALGRLGVGRALWPLVEVLDDDTADVRVAAAEALKALTKVANVEGELARALKDPGRRHRSHVVKTLVELKARGGGDALVPLLEQDDDMRQAAVEALMTIEGSAATDTLIPLLQHRRPGMRRAAIIALAQTRDPRAVDPLCRLLVDPDDEQSMQVLWAFREFPDAVLPRFVVLVAQLCAEDPVERRGALEPLAELADPRATHFLIRALDDDYDFIGHHPFLGDHEVQAKAYGRVMEALRRIGEPAVAPLIAKLETSAIERAAKVLVGIGDKRAVEPLAMALRARPSGAVAQALAGFDPEHALSVLVSALDDPDVEVGCGAAVALGELGARAADILLPRLASAEPSVRWAATVGLGTMGDIRALPPLVAALESNSDSVARKRAAELLGRLAARRALDPLTKVIDGDAAWFVRRAAAVALGNIGGTECAEVLVAWLQTPDGRIREDVLAGLRELARSAEREPSAQRVAALAMALGGLSSALLRHQSEHGPYTDDGRDARVAVDDMSLALERIGGPEAEHALARWKASEEILEAIEELERWRHRGLVENVVDVALRSEVGTEGDDSRFIVELIHHVAAGLSEMAQISDASLAQAAETAARDAATAYPAEHFRMFDVPPNWCVLPGEIGSLVRGLAGAAVPAYVRALQSAERASGDRRH